MDRSVTMRILGAVLALAACTASTGKPVLDISGTGPSVILIGGHGETSAAWSSVRAEIDHCVTAVVFELPGTGRNADLAFPNPTLGDDIAKMLSSALSNNRIPPPYILVGHSLGGLYALSFQHNYPEPVAALVLLDATTQFEPPGVFVPKTPPPPGSASAAAEAGISATSVSLQGQSIVGPLLVLAATDHADTQEREALWLKVQERAAALSPASHLIVVKSGHDIQIEHPDLVANAILNVMKESNLECGLP
jgi:pimeloyl-ACP methyl ester carboxylesterase